MGLMKEFKEFAMRGNVVDLAVGVIIGAAFGKIVTSMVDDVLMPAIGMAIGKVDFSKLMVVLKSHEVTDAAGKTSVVIDSAIRYGQFINTIINFAIVAFCIFMVIKAMNKAFPKAPPPPPPGPTKDQLLLTEIRDALLRK
jgi:large conductance mechanosensitive channel